jgi:hypothetical protein
MRLIQRFCYLLAIQLIAASFIATQALATTPKICGYLEYKGLSEGSLDVAKPTPQRHFPRGVDPAQKPEWNLMAGFESEYTMKESAKLLEVYAPPEALLALTQWKTMDHAAKLNFIQTHRDQIFPKGRPGFAAASGKTGLIKRNSDPKFEKLPESLVLDETGNFEIITQPMNSLSELVGIIGFINREFGVGSMQATLSTPADHFFGRSENRNAAEVNLENRSFFRFIQEFDALAKMHLGVEKYARNPNRPVMLAFAHQWLGPPTNYRRERTERFLELNQRGEGYDQYEISLIKGRDYSPKYLGSTVYRPDIGGRERVAAEVRDANKSWETLRERILRASYALLNDRSAFKPADVLRAFDPNADFARLPQPLQDMLHNLIPNRQDPSIAYDSMGRLALDVARNFAYPMRDWSGHVELIGKPGLEAQVAAAQNSYLNKMQGIHADLNAQRIDKQTAINRVHGAVAEFSTESGIFEGMQKWYEERIAHQPQFIEFMKTLPAELVEAAPASGD